MTPTSINNFLLSLAVAIAAATTPALVIAPTPPAKRSIWVHDAIEDDSTDVYTVLRIYGGDDAGIPSVSIQADTRGPDEQNVLSQAFAVQQTLVDDDDQPWLEKSIAGKKFASDGSITADAGNWIVSIRNLTAPGIVGRDESDRRIATGNFDAELRFVAT